VAEYWIVEPIRERVTLLELVDGFYEEVVYQGDQRVISPVLADFPLTVAQILGLTDR